MPNHTKINTLLINKTDYIINPFVQITSTTKCKITIQSRDTYKDYLPKNKNL